MPNQAEPNANNSLGDLLCAMMPGNLVRSENTQTFPAHPGRHADALITVRSSSIGSGSEGRVAFLRRAFDGVWGRATPVSRHGSFGPRPA